MYCHKCGKQIADDSAFCSKCGAAQQTKSGSAPANPVWEYCEIMYYMEGTTFGFGRPTWYFWADATGPGGGYNAGKSVEFKSHGERAFRDLPR